MSSQHTNTLSVRPEHCSPDPQALTRKLFFPHVHAHANSLAIPSISCSSAKGLLSSRQLSYAHVSQSILSRGSCSSNSEAMLDRSFPNPLAITLPTLAPYQLTIRTALFSAMNGRSPLAFHTAKQIQRRHWGIAQEMVPISEARGCVPLVSGQKESC